MPVEMLEMVIKANLTEEKAKKENKNPVQEQVNQLFDKQTLTEDIFAQVIAYLEHKAER